PFGIALDPLGNLFTCDCHSRPIYQLLRGAYYPSFGKPHDGLGFGPEMMTHDHGSTGIAGIAYYAADHFPANWRDTVFVGNVVTSRINHDRLERHGSTLLARAQPDFLVSDDPWFRPVDIKLGPDGALYVADFYNRIIGHYEVPLTHPGRDRERGRIWRIVYRGPDGRGGPKSPRSDWTSASVAELIQDLAHPNLTVRLKATHQLAQRPGDEPTRAVREALKGAASPWVRMHGLWVLERRKALDDATLAAGTRDPEPGVRVHALRILAERADLAPADRSLVLAGLKDDDAFVQRAAAEALGRHPSSDNLRPLLDLRHAVPAEDTHLRHVVRMALRDQLRPDSAWEQVARMPLSEADTLALADVALGVPSPEAARFLLRQARRLSLGDAMLIGAVHHIARYGPEEAELLDFVRQHRPDDLGHQAALIRAIQQGTQERGGALSPPARDWAVSIIRRLIASAQDSQAKTGLELAGSLKLSEIQEAVVAVAKDRQASEARRAAALTALSQIDPQAGLAILGRILDEVSEPLALRERAATLLAQGNQNAARERLLAVLPQAPGPLQTTIALGLAGTRPGAEALLTLIADGKASARLLQERPVEMRLRAAGPKDLEARLARLRNDLPAADSRLQELLKRRQAGFAAAQGDPARGALVFEKTCAACHQLEGKGARIGPQLDGIGARGADRLMEDILDPNRNVDQAFRMTTLALTDGRIVSGLLLREEGEVLVLADSQGQEVRIPRDMVEERTVSPLSPMPANLADQIDESAFYDLIAYLLSRREPMPTP
ncbi:MAG: HEAT repeat domain-containing protein, partial [Isosphaeraceae bacterium]|nr:HEAT repeat domain-containing protein [Isosphaeraceae bacterium]